MKKKKLLKVPDSVRGKLPKLDPKVRIATKKLNPYAELAKKLNPIYYQLAEKLENIQESVKPLSPLKPLEAIAFILDSCLYSEFTKTERRIADVLIRNGDIVVDNDMVLGIGVIKGKNVKRNTQ